ncbi:MAG TPA: Eco57I restriction-modification methylase domain-containing protein, partial [Desulfuromonadaceae bacterium]
MTEFSVFEQLALWNPNPADHPVPETASRERGAVYTRCETVEFILDLVGYTVDRPLHQLTLLEPSFGTGDFLMPVVERLMYSYLRNNTTEHAVTDLRHAIVAVEIDPFAAAQTVARLEATLTGFGLDREGIVALLGVWLRSGDFLLADVAARFDFVVGNPPYVRQELIPEGLMTEYRARFETIYDRADLYVPFIERGLSLLAPDGVLGYICADRWMKNKYGGPLRALVARQYHLDCYVDMVDTQAFLSEVSAYPAIFVISRRRKGTTRIAHRPRIE